MKANRSTNEKRTIAGTPRNDGTGLVASASVLPLAWTDYAWNVEISMCRPGLVTQFPFLPVIAMDNGGTMSDYHKPRTRRDGTMTALVIYDNLASATTTVATLQYAAHRAELNSQWNIKPWRVDVLRFPLAADEALKEATDADLIVFAGPQAYQPPAWLKEWLECWAERRQVEDAALVVMRGGNGGKIASPAEPELSRFALRHGLSFIIEIESVRAHVAASVVRTQRERKLPARPVTEGTISMPIHCSYRDWGINE